MFVNWRAALSSAVFTGVLLGQSRRVQSANAGFEFEAASVRPAAPVVGEFAAGPFGGPGSADPIRIRGINLTLKALLMRAYQVRYEQISGPGWIESARFDLVATVRLGATSEQVNEMLKNLLLERFQLVVHHEIRELPVFELVQMQKQKRTKLREASAGASTAGKSLTTPSNKDGFPEIPAERTTGLWQGLNPAGRVRVTGRNQPISELIRAIGNQAGRPVVDKTGLAGRYDFVLEYANVVGAIGAMGMPMPAPSPVGLPPRDNERDAPPPLTAAIKEQLGLQLKPAKGKLDVIVIDRALKMPVQD